MDERPAPEGTSRTRVGRAGGIYSRNTHHATVQGYSKMDRQIYNCMMYRTPCTNFLKSRKNESKSMGKRIGRK